MAESRGRILVVDDELNVAQVLAEHLTEQGYEVATAHGGIEALAKIDLEKPQVILLDVRMPGMDGIEVLRRIRSFDTQVGILMISANDDVELAKQTLAMGAFDYTLKPIDFAYLSRAVDTMMARSPALPPPDVDGERAATPSAHNLLYDLALDIFRTARALSPVARESLGRELEQAALVALQRGAGGEKQEVVRALNQVRTLLRFAKDLADISDDAHRVLEASVARARRSIGLS
ncbi:MAG TPA: response regulator [Candidatus Acidoferrum sp.]|jgi:DNA-binding response OmpR family regulator|nr:response regulator [Candidatus Acidoferrum sp.]